MKKYLFLIIAIIFTTTLSIAQNVGIGTTDPDEKLTVVGTIKSNINSNSNFPHIHIHEDDSDYGRIKYTNTSSSQYFMLSGNPQRDSTMARFHINNSDFGNIGSFTGHGRFGINASNPAATLHLSSQPGTDLMRIQNENNTKFRIFSNNAIVFGANWQTPIPNVIRMVSPNVMIGFNENYTPSEKLEVDGTINVKGFKMSIGAEQNRVLTSDGSGKAKWLPSQDDGDADPNNEIQIISENLGTVTLSGGGGSFVDSVKDADADPNNEIQTISKSFGTVTLSNGGGFFFDEVNDNDSNPTNEIQTLSKSGNTVSLSNGGGSFTLDNDAREIGDNAYGGIVFWLDESGEHGLVASTTDIGGTYEWGTQTSTYYDADGTGIYSGKRNTLLIIEHTSGSSITCAAKACQNYSGGNYGDWYLPSTTEFSILRSAAASLSNLNLTGDFYWTSKEEIDSGAGDVKARTYWGVGTGNSVLQSKTTQNRVRGIRAF